MRPSSKPPGLPESPDDAWHVCGIQSEDVGIFSMGNLGTGKEIMSDRHLCEFKASVIIECHGPQLMPML
jgi:hypothetical protein